MDDHRIHTIVPRLRFPDFLNDGEWEVKLLGEIADYENGIAHENDIDSDGDFIIVNSKFISSDGQIKKRTNVPRCLAQKDDVLMVLSDLPNGRALAKCFYVAENNLYTVNQRICKFHPKNVHSKLLYYLVNRNEYFLSFDDGVKQTNLKKGDVLNCPLIIPKSIEEQDFIAICLTSLDEMLSATNGKLEQLKAYKKGLMQKLFPAKGKKLPELRFKEFEKDGEWEEKKLGEITTDIYQPQTISQSQFSADGYPVYGANGIIGYYEFYNHDTDQILVTCRGSSCGTINYSVGKCWITGNAMVINLDSVQDCYDKRFVYYMLLNKDLSKLITGSGQPQIVRAPLLNLEVNITNSIYEQRRIADCFDLIDEMINQYTNKVAVLELYKKGLMQRMFPTSK